MSIFGLFNKKCSWKRNSRTGYDKYEAPLYTDVTIASDIPCRIEDIEGWNTWEAEPGGDFSRSKKILYLGYGYDIQGNDKVTVNGSDNYKVIMPDDAAGYGHHLEVRVEHVDEL